MSYRPETPEQTVTRFWSKIDVRAAGECWEWSGERLTGRGYGRFNIYPGGKRTSFLAHRYVLPLIGRNIPEGHVVMHSCDNPPCVNPAHLSTGTQAENLRDMEAKGRANRSGLMLAPNHIIAAARRAS